MLDFNNLFVYHSEFNLKYTSSSQMSVSQPDLDNTEKSELSVHTKASEIIGRLKCVLWVYCEVYYSLNLFLFHYIDTHVKYEIIIRKY